MEQCSRCDKRDAAFPCGVCSCACHSNVSDWLYSKAGE